MTFNEKLNKAKTGSSIDYEILCGDYADCLYTVAFLSLKDEKDAEAAVKSAVSGARSQIERIKDEPHFRAWLVRELTRNLVAKLKEYKADGISVRDTSGISVPEKVTALKMPDLERLVFAISVACGYSSREISVLTGLAEDMVAEKIKSADKRLGAEAQKLISFAENFTAPDSLKPKAKENNTKFIRFMPKTDETDETEEPYNENETEETAAEAAGQTETEAAAVAAEAEDKEEVHAEASEESVSEQNAENPDDEPVFAEEDPEVKLDAATFISIVSAEKIKGSEFLRMIGNTRISNSAYREIEQNPKLTKGRLIQLLEESPLTEADYAKLLAAIKERRKAVDAREETRAIHEKAGLFDGYRRERPKRKPPEEKKSELQKALELSSSKSEEKPAEAPKENGYAINGTLSFDKPKETLRYDEQEISDSDEPFSPDIMFEPEDDEEPDYSGTTAIPRIKESAVHAVSTEKEIKTEIKAEEKSEKAENSVKRPHGKTSIIENINANLSQMSQAAVEDFTSEPFSPKIFDEILDSAVDPYELVDKNRTDSSKSSRSAEPVVENKEPLSEENKRETSEINGDTEQNTDKSDAFTPEFVDALSDDDDNDNDNEADEELPVKNRKAVRDEDDAVTEEDKPLKKKKQVKDKENTDETEESGDSDSNETVSERENKYKGNEFFYDDEKYTEGINRGKIIFCAVCAALLVAGSFLVRYVVTGSALPTGDDKAPTSSSISAAAELIGISSYSDIAEKAINAGTKENRFANKYFNASSKPYETGLTRSIAETEDTFYIYGNGEIVSVKPFGASPTEAGRADIDDIGLIGFTAYEDKLFVVFNDRSNVKSGVIVKTYNDNMELMDTYSQDGTFVRADLINGSLSLVTFFNIPDGAEADNPDSFIPSVCGEMITAENISVIDGADNAAFTVAGSTDGSNARAYFGGYNCYAAAEDDGYRLLIADNSRTYSVKGNNIRVYTGEAFSENCLGGDVFIGFNTDDSAIVITNDRKSVSFTVKDEIPSGAANSGDGRMYVVTALSDGTSKLYGFNVSGGEITDAEFRSECIYTEKLSLCGSGLVGLKAESDSDGNRTGLRLSLYDYDNKLNEKAYSVLGLDEKTGSENLRYLRSDAESDSRWIASNEEGTMFAVSEIYFDGISEIERIISLGYDGNVIKETGDMLLFDVNSPYRALSIRGGKLYIITQSAIITADAKTCEPTGYVNLKEEPVTAETEEADSQAEETENGGSEEPDAEIAE